MEEIYGTLPPKAVAINSLSNLKKMQIWGYKPKGKNLKEFTDLKALGNLELISSNITSLDGIDGLKELNRLALFRMRALTDIEAIQYLSKNLMTLKIEFAKKIEDFSPIGKIQSLESLSLNDCGNVQSIRFTEQLANLKTLVLADSTVVDGDVSHCIEMKYAYFTNKKHYSHRLIEGHRLNDPHTFIEKSKPEDTESLSKTKIKRNKLCLHMRGE